MNTKSASHMSQKDLESRKQPLYILSFLNSSMGLQPVGTIALQIYAYVYVYVYACMCVKGK